MLQINFHILNYICLVQIIWNNQFYKYKLVKYFYILDLGIMQEVFHGYDVQNIFLLNRLVFNHKQLKKWRQKLDLVSKRTLRYYVKNYYCILF